VIGVSGQVVTSGIVKVGSIQGACGKLLAAGPSCQIRIDPGATLAERGVKGSSFFTQRCPSDSVVVAFRGHYGGYLDQLSLECASLSLSIDSRPTVSTGRTTVIAPNGGAGGIYFEERCPRDEVARGLNVRVDGNGFLQSLGFTCGDPAAR
jgi:hypothetical protein